MPSVTPSLTLRVADRLTTAVVGSKTGSCGVGSGMMGSAGTSSSAGSSGSDGVGPFPCGASGPAGAGAGSDAGAGAPSAAGVPFDPFAAALAVAPRRFP